MLDSGLSNVIKFIDLASTIDIIGFMKDAVCIISFGNGSKTPIIEQALRQAGFTPEIAVIKKCAHLSDISEYFIPSTEIVKGVEKGYLKDGRIDQAAILSVQKSSINKVLTKFSKCRIFFIEDDPCPESFYIKKLFFKEKISFFSFGNISDKEHITVLKKSLDIGFHHNTFQNFVFKEKIENSINIPCFNGLIAIEPPPDTIPLRYLLHFRSSQLIVRNVIKTMNGFYKFGKHPKILILNPVRPYNSYTTSSRALQIGKFFGERASHFNDHSELSPGTTVLTWSTKRYFFLLNAGLRPVPMTKCLVSSIYNARKKNIEELIMFKPADDDLNKLAHFLNTSGVENISEMMYKLMRSLKKG